MRTDLQTQQSRLTPNQAFSICDKYQSNLEQCLPFATFDTPVEGNRDVVELNNACFIKLKNSKTQLETCNELLSQSLGRLSVDKLMNSDEVSFSYPIVHECASVLLYIITIKTKDITDLNKLCSGELRNTTACTNREENFNKVFPSKTNNKPL